MNILWQELAAAMMEMTFNKDETIFEQGVPCEYAEKTTRWREHAPPKKIRNKIQGVFGCQRVVGMNENSDVCDIES